MERYYFTFMMGDAQRHNCYHVEEAESYGEARDKMVEKFGTGWAFQYVENIQGTVRKVLQLQPF